MPMRRAEQFSIQTIRPGMIRALNRLVELAALFLAQTRAAMAADIVESAHFSLLIPQNDQAFTRHLRHEIITRLRQFTLMAHAQPSAGKNAF